MTIDKIHLKALFAEGLGRDLEKDLEAAQIKVHKWQGADDALTQAAKILSDKCGALKNKLLSGEISLDPTDNLAAAKFVVAQIQAIAVTTLLELADTAKKSTVKAAGECEGIDFSLKKVKAIFDEEKAKLENIAKAVEDGEVKIEPDGSLQALGNGPRYPGAHPGPTLKQQRTEQPPLSQEDIASTAAPKRRGRRRKGEGNAANG